jgi:hypothetical protein
VRKKVNPLHAKRITHVDWKDTTLLRQFLSDRGKIRRAPGDRADPAAAAAGGHGHPQRPGDGAAALPRPAGLTRSPRPVRPSGVGTPVPPARSGV